MLQAPEVLAVVANTCQRPSTWTIEGSFTETIGCVASCSAVISGPGDVHLNEAGRPESVGGAPPAPPVPVVDPLSGSLAHAIAASARSVIVERDITRLLGVSIPDRSSPFDREGDDVSFPRRNIS